ncbi:MAG: putative baseplate assembly protein, partial [bacterium]|nr:putative baseplate assembly protein [bacterium]
RHFVLERVQGRIQFGDGRRGKIPPAGANNIRVASYQAGGGSRGNVAIDAISQILGAVPSAESVTNPLMAEGGSEPESFEGVEERGTAIMRNRGQAISRDDFEAIALSTSTSVAVARALPVTRADGISRAGCVQVVILPRSGDARPLPSYGLRRQVLRHLQARCPATAASRLSVVGPTYLPVDVSVQAAALNPDATGEVIARIEDAIAEFLHPLHGGPLGKGWCFGREMHLSDLAARLEGLEGVDYLHSLEFLLQGALQGDSVAVPADRIICAGDIAVLGAGGDL